MSIIVALLAPGWRTPSPWYFSSVKPGSLSPSGCVHGWTTCIWERCSMVCALSQRPRGRRCFPGGLCPGRAGEHRRLVEARITASPGPGTGLGYYFWLLLPKPGKSRDGLGTRGKTIHPASASLLRRNSVSKDSFMVSNRYQVCIVESLENKQVTRNIPHPRLCGT